MSLYLLLLSVVLSGCTLFKRPISSSIGDGKGDDVVVITTAKERAISYLKAELDPIRQRIKPNRIVCAEPSPDVATAVSDAIQATLKAHATKLGVGEAGLEAGFSRAFSESIAQLGTRLATIQLLRDELSDLCRAYANGAVSSITYTLRLSRLDKKMITLLIGEAGAGALSRALINTTGSASVGGGVASKEKLDKADQRIKEATEAVSEANKALKGLVENRNKETQPEKIKEADVKIAEAEALVKSRLAELSERMLEKWALETQGSGLIAATNAGAIAALSGYPQALSSLDLGNIHRSFLENDDLGTLIDACLTSLEQFQPPTASDVQVQLQEVNKKILDKQLDINSLKAKAENARVIARQSRGLSENTPRKISDEELALENAEDELTALLRDAEELKGYSGTGLASYCRNNGLSRIIEIMTNKIESKFSSEYSNRIIDLCKTAVTSKNDKIINECATVLPYLDRERPLNIRSMRY
jgi:hypothetical protein